MEYYKFVSGGDVVSVTDCPVWVRVSNRGRLLRCSLSDAHGVLAADNSTLYHIAGTKPLGDGVYEDVFVSSITEEEFTNLSELLAQCHTPQDVQVPEIIADQDEVAHEDPVYLEQIRNLVLRAMSGACRNAIITGIDVELSDGSVSHFDLTVEDQLNIISAVNLLDAGADSVPFHASGEMFRYFDSKDIRTIATKASDYKTRQIAYHNSLKNWIQSMSSIKDLTAVYYGIDIPREYCSEVFLQMQYE